MRTIKKLAKLMKWFIDEQGELCPHCGYYCTGKTVFCNSPLHLLDKVNEEDDKIVSNDAN